MNERKEEEGFAITSDGLEKHVKKEREEGLRIATVNPGQTIVITTNSGTRYRFLVEDPERGVGQIKGGEYFQESTRVRLMGSKARQDSRMIIGGVIQKGLVLEIQGISGEKKISEHNIINTSAIKEIYIEG